MEASVQMNPSELLKGSTPEPEYDVTGDKLVSKILEYSWIASAVSKATAQQHDNQEYDKDSYDHGSLLEKQPVSGLEELY